MSFRSELWGQAIAIWKITKKKCPQRQITWWKRLASKPYGASFPPRTLCAAQKSASSFSDLNFGIFFKEYQAEDFSSSHINSIILGILALTSGDNSMPISRDSGSIPITVVWGVFPISPDKFITSNMPIW
jgi:hypothetical protein